jgi:ribosomal protein S12 methylthiotransferase
MKKIYMHSLGCSKNLVDSENMLGILEKKGYKYNFSKQHLFPSSI